MIKVKKYLLFLFILVITALFLSGCVYIIKRQKFVKKTVEVPAAQEKAPAVERVVEVCKTQAAPDFKLKDLSHETFTLSSYKGRQPVVLFFWTTKCPFCVSELRMLRDMYPEMVKQGWELLAIDVGEYAYRVDRYAKKYALNFKVLLDSDINVARDYDILGVPTYVFVDKKGCIAFMDHYFSQEKYQELTLK